MKHLLVMIAFCLGGIAPLQAQVLTGRIVDEKSKPLPYTTIYIIEKQSGIVSNEHGEFSIHLNKGVYTLRFQYMGYESQTTQVNISENQQLKIQLKPASIELKGVVIVANAEDPAYNIIRKAIAKAPYHDSQVPSYTSNVYIKGNLYVDKVPRLLSTVDSLSTQKNGISMLKEGSVFTKESVNEIIKTPAQIKQKIISENSSFPEVVESENDIYNTFSLFNIYTMDASPISRSALSNYKYKLERSETHGNRKIHHIQVIPKTANPALYKGTIDIVDGLWCVHNFDLSGSINMGFFSANFQFKQTFSELEVKVYRPVSYVVFFDIKMFGIKMRMNNAASIKYLQYKINDNPTKPFSALVSKDTLPYVISKKSQQIEAAINTLSAKENLSNGEALKILTLFEKKAKEDRKNNETYYAKKSLEIKDSTYLLTIDSNVHKHDSAYWEKQRTASLSEEERAGFVKKENYLKAKENDTAKKPVNKNTFANIVLQNLFGFTAEIDSTSSIGYKFSGQFNTVDGFELGANLVFKKEFKDSKQWETNLRTSYTFTTRHFPSTLSSTYRYAPRKQAFATISGGRKSSDFNSESGISAGLNTFTSLFFRENYINFYDKTFVDIKHSIEIFNGFTFDAGFTYERQEKLQNNSDYSFFFRHSWNYRNNDPRNSYLLSNTSFLDNSTGSILDIKISYTPQMYYRYYKNKKINIRSNYPTFSLAWKKGIAGLFNGENQFDLLEANMTHKVSLGFLKSLQYDISGGWFPSNKSMHFSNFKHFNIGEFPVSVNPLNRMYHTMQTYTPSTNEWFLSGFLHYENPYLLIKYLPIFNKTVITENLYASYLNTPVSRNYMEVGYALEKIYLLGSIGVFVGFENFKYANWNVKMSISLPSSF